MNTETEEILKIVTAFKEGKVVMRRRIGKKRESSWTVVENNNFNFEKYEYRVEGRWRAKNGERYFCITESFQVANRVETGSPNDTIQWRGRNYFKNEDTAKGVLKAIECYVDTVTPQTISLKKEKTVPKLTIRKFGPRKKTDDEYREDYKSVISDINCVGTKMTDIAKKYDVSIGTVHMLKAKYCK